MTGSASRSTKAIMRTSAKRRQQEATDLKVLRDLTHETLEGELPDEELS